VIGTNKKDSQDTVDTLLADLAAARESGAPAFADFPADHADKLADWLLSRQPKLITATHWQAIDQHERSAGEPHGRPRVKLSSLDELLRIAHG
jgi:ferredoxin--NADP+ reductase